MASIAGLDMRLERRLRQPRWLTLVVPLVSVVAALILGALFLILTGHGPLTVYRELLKGGFTTFYGFTDSLAVATPLIFTGLAAAFAMRMNLYNIGGEGQLYAGAIAASWAGLTLGDDLPKPLMVIVLFAAGAAGGSVWMLIPAVARARFGTSEIITTLLFNYVALFLMRYLIFGSASFWRDPAVTNFPQGKKIPVEARFSAFGSTRVTLALFVAVLFVLLCFVTWAYTSFGYDVTVLADSQRAARYAGIAIAPTIVVVLLISGGLAGMAGASEIGARAYALDPNGLAINLGYTGIVVAALARTNPFAVGLVALLLGGLQNAGVSLQSLGGERVPIAVTQMLQGAILLFALGGEIFRRNRLVVRRQAQGAVMVEVGQP